MGGGIHEQHAQKHDMASHTAGLSVVNLDSRFGSDLGLLDVEEAGFLSVTARFQRSARVNLLDVVSRNVDDGEEQHGVGNLTMEPQVLVQGQEPDLRTDPSHDGPTYGKQDQGGIDGQD